MSLTDLLFLSLPAALAGIKLTALLLAATCALRGLCAPRGMFFGVSPEAGGEMQQPAAGPTIAR